MSKALPTPEEIGAAAAEPPCPFYAQCGGCSLQHVSEDFYRAWKIKILKDALAGVVVGTFKPPIFLPAASRRRAAMAAVKTAKGVVLGYNTARSRNIVDIDHCLVLEPALDKKIQAMREYLPRILPDGLPCDITVQHAEGAFDVLLTGAFKRDDYEFLETTAEMAESLDLARISIRAKDTQEPEVLLARKKVFKTFGAITVELAPGAFLQASTAGENALASFVLSAAKNSKSAADLFCGHGTFAGHLLKNGTKVCAIESDEAAIKNLRKAGHENLNSSQRNLFKKPLTASELKFDTVVFDPPRAGAAAQVSELAKSGVARIIAVSCNPASFAQDAKTLINGGYTLDEVTVIDQFSWSSHVELAALFTRA